MSTIGDKIKQVFAGAAVYKNPANYEVFNGRNLPSFVKDYLISTHIAADGSFKREALTQFLDAHIPKENSAILARLRRGEILTLLTRFVVTTSLAQNKTSFQIPDMGIKASDTLIPDYLIEENPDDLIDGEKWGIMKIVYIAPTDNERGHVEMVKFKPFRPMQKLDINYIRNCRAQFSLEEWIDVLISAMEYTPTAFDSTTQKLEFLTRLLPFIEPRLNLIELAPKGTGKSYVFGNLSKFVWLVSGGKVSRAKLVYDKSTKSPGIMRFYDMVAFDEIQKLAFADPDEMSQTFKGYMEQGIVSFGGHTGTPEAGVILLGNIPQDNMNEFVPMFGTLPELFRESALLDRFHGFIKGWDIPRMTESMKICGWALNTAYFCEILHILRDDVSYRAVVDELLEYDANSDTRDV
jgi:ATP-dependent Lon protease